MCHRLCVRRFLGLGESVELLLQSVDGLPQLLLSRLDEAQRAAGLGAQHRRAVQHHPQVFARRVVHRQRAAILPGGEVLQHRAAVDVERRPWGVLVLPEILRERRERRHREMK